MGCDIHMVLEKQHNGKWIGVDPFNGHQSADGKYAWPACTSRNYLRFAAMANVRGEGPEPKGIPEDISDLTRMLIAEWDGDGHSHSWMTASEAATLFNEVRYPQEEKLDPEGYQAKYPTSYWFGIEDAENYRIVFWFDN